MGTKIILNESLLRQKYISENMSQKAVAKYFGVSVDTIVRNLRDYGIQPHVNRDWSCSPKIQLSDIQKEVLYGALLGDGCLHINKNGINANFFYASKSYQHVCYVYSFLKNIPKELRQLYIMMKEQIKVIKSIDLGHVQTMDLPMSIINGI